MLQGVLSLSWSARWATKRIAAAATTRSIRTTQTRWSSQASTKADAIVYSHSNERGASVTPISYQPTLRAAPRPVSEFLTDRFRRQHDYLRISLTERCNLRCVYCMPEGGVSLSPPADLLTTSEIITLCSLFVSQGVVKIRLTGGEPTVRKDILPLMREIGALKASGLRELCLTTNGLALRHKLDDMVQAGLTGVNISLDTLDPWKYQIMTRRKGFDAVIRSIDHILELNRRGAGLKIKINCVVMRGVNESEIKPFIDMTREKNLEVRFIEYMPFDGNKWDKEKMVSYAEMLDIVKGHYPTLEKVSGSKNDTSRIWSIPGFAGKLGFITSMTRNFCGGCNRLRLTSDGNLKVCLFGNAEVSLRDILREPSNSEPITDVNDGLPGKRDKPRSHESLGLQACGHPIPNEQKLLSIIGLAVKRKKERHAGIGQLEFMKNRPMILIGQIIDRMRAVCTGFGSEDQRLPQLLPSGASLVHFPAQITRSFSSSPKRLNQSSEYSLTHVHKAGSAHMVSISDKSSTIRTAKAVCRVTFSNDIAVRLIEENQIKKGDVLATARVAGIMAAKRTPDLIPLCHPIPISYIAVDLSIGSPLSEHSSVDKTPAPSPFIDIEVTVSSEGKTGVEMEALTAASTAALTVYDMCKSVDKAMVIEGLRVTLKEGGKSGTTVMGKQANLADTEVAADIDSHPR